MEIKKASYYKTALKMDQLPETGLDEVCLIGRSNVGKSSFINSICNNNKLARTSKTPGKTITLNFYLINDSFYFVDMPGYGFQSRNNKTMIEFSEASEEYLTTRDKLKGIIQIIDSRVVTKDDMDMVEYLKTKDVPYLIILSKIDKLKRNDILKRVKETANILGVDKSIIQPYSSLSLENKDKVLNRIEELVYGKEEEL